MTILSGELLKDDWKECAFHHQNVYSNLTKIHTDSDHRKYFGRNGISIPAV